MKKLLALLISVFLLCGTALATESAVASGVSALPETNTPVSGVSEPSAPDASVPPPSVSADSGAGTSGDNAPEVPGAGPEADPYPFVRVYTYAGQFSDLKPEDTFYENIAALYEYGLSIGQKDGTYGARAKATVGQGIIFAARLRSLYDHGDAEIGAAAFRTEGQHTYDAYLLYLQSQSILGNELDGQYFSTATRAVMAHILTSALPEEAFPAINHDAVTLGYASRRFIQDVDEYTPYFQDILTLYRSGICQGVDGSGTFLPNDPISRGALAAMLTRIADPDLRITLHWELDAAPDVTWGDLVKAPETVPAAPSTDEEFDAAIRYMLSQDDLSMSLNYGQPVDSTFVSSVLQTSLRIIGRYSENMLNYATCSYYEKTGEMTVSFSVTGASATETVAYRDATLEAALAVRDELWANGFLQPSMTQQEKALIYFRWICENCVYDTEADDNSISHTAWSLFTRGLAVCDGYTGAYNLLLKLEGIDCYTLAGSEHAWTVATLDGTEYHIDTTWGDSSIIFANELYFAMSPTLSYGFHPWEKAA